MENVVECIYRKMFIHTIDDARIHFTDIRLLLTQCEYVCVFIIIVVVILYYLLI